MPITSPRLRAAAITLTVAAAILAIVVGILAAVAAPSSPSCTEYHQDGQVTAC